MNIYLRGLVAMLAAVFGAGLFLVSTTSGATAGSDDRAVLAKRQDSVSELVAVDDDDDDAKDPTDTRTNNTNSHTGQSNSANDNTNSRVTNVSRDRDLSRRDLTKDGTRDGGDRTRDHSRNYTNDASRHDTRG